MEYNIEEAIRIYSGNRPMGLFVEQLPHNLERLNATFDEISHLFMLAGIENFEKLPEDRAERGRFAKLFKLLNDHLEAAKTKDLSGVNQNIVLVKESQTYHRHELR
jgi:type I restriction enzyme R subunit